MCRRLLEKPGAVPLSEATIADVGCGAGQWLEEYVRWGAQPGRLHGIDLLSERVAAASARLPDADLRTGDARYLPWPDASFDLVTQFTVFSSVLDAAVRRAIAAEMLRVLRPGGRILWYDCRYSNPFRAAVQGVSSDEIRTLFPNSTIDFAVTTLVPPLSRVIAHYSPAAAAALESLRFTCTHLAAVIVPKKT